MRKREFLVSALMVLPTVAALYGCQQKPAEGSNPAPVPVTTARPLPPPGSVKTQAAVPDDQLYAAPAGERTGLVPNKR